MENLLIDCFSFMVLLLLSIIFFLYAFIQIYLSIIFYDFLINYLDLLIPILLNIIIYFMNFILMLLFSFKHKYKFYRLVLVLSIMATVIFFVDLLICYLDKSGSISIFKDIGIYVFLIELLPIIFLSCYMPKAREALNEVLLD